MQSSETSGSSPRISSPTEGTASAEGTPVLLPSSDPVQVITHTAISRLLSQEEPPKAASLESHQFTARGPSDVTSRFHQETTDELLQELYMKEFNAQEQKAIEERFP